MQKIAVFISHPIQYQVPLFKKLAAEPGIDLIVFFFWDYGVKETYDPQFGQKIKWDIPLLDGYRSEFLKNISSNQTSAHFLGEINPGLFSRIIKGNYDALIIFGWQTLSHWLAILTGFLVGTPVFIRGENPFNQELKKNFFKRIIKQIILRGLFKLVQGFFYIGEENKNFYLYYGVPKSKLYFIPYAVDNDRFITEAKRFKPLKNKLKAKLGIKEKQKVILFSGKLVSGKRPLDLILAYEKLIDGKLKKGILNPALVFIGNGPIKNKLEEYVKKNKLKDVYFTGFKNQNEIAEFYAIGDVFVLPSGGETWGLVVNEAMCFNLPVIISDAVSCGRDLIIQGKNGYIFPVGDIELLSNYLKEILSSQKICREMGKKSKEIIFKWSFNQNVKDILDAVNYNKEK